MAKSSFVANPAKIRVVGLGGAGSNAVTRMVTPLFAIRAIANAAKYIRKGAGVGLGIERYDRNAGVLLA